MKNPVKNMKVLIPFLTLFLASCGVHNHRYDADEDVYYQEDYYAYDNYDPYYGYGSGEYSTSGDGVYYNNYNYYPDRWGVTYSNVYYSPYRYPRVGFYYSSAYSCGHSYWSNGCSSSFWSPFYTRHNLYGGSSWGFGLGYSNYYYDNYWWYNHWRNRNYNHHRPSRHGYYSARNETRRLTNNRYRSNYKNNPGGRYNRNGNNNQRGGISRNRSSSNRSINRPANRSTNQSRPARSSQPIQRSRQQSATSTRQAIRQNNNNVSASSREQVISRSPGTNLQQRIREDNNQQQNRSRYQKPALVTKLPPNRSSNRNSTTHTQSKPATLNNRMRVKPMNSQSPVYHTNTRPVIRNQSPPKVEYQRSNVNIRNNRSTGSSVATNNRPTQSKPQPVTRAITKSQKVQKSRSNKKSSKSNKSSNSRSNNSSRARDRNR